MFDAVNFDANECSNWEWECWAADPLLPEDTARFVLLRTVYLAFGRIRFGSGWTGLEWHARLPPILPDVVHPSLYESIAPGSVEENSRPAVWFVMPDQAATAYARRLLSADTEQQLQKWDQWCKLAPSSQQAPFTVGEWRRAQELSKAHRNVVFSAVGRRYEVAEVVRRLFAEGELECVLRPTDGGEFTETLPNWVWNTERYHSRFSTWRMNRNEIFDENSNAAPTDWIFCERRSFEALCNRLMAPTIDNAPEASGLPYLSEFMICALQVSKALGMSPEHQPKKEEVMAEVRRLWKGPEPISSTMAERIASVVRSLDSQGGRNSKKQKKV